MRPWIRTSNPVLKFKSGFLSRIRTSTVRGITWCSQQSKNVHSLNRTLLGETNTRWDRWQIMLKLAILAKEGISIDTLREDPPDKVTLPPEPIYEDNIENSTSQSERDKKARNKQLKNAWLIRCQKIEPVGILCGDKHWKYCDKKAVCLTYLSLGMEGR